MNGFTAADMSTAAANGFRDGLAAQPAAATGIDLQAPCTEAVYALARKLLWIAYVWNDHNFDHPYKIARALAQEFGIESFDQANAWLGEQAKLIDASPKGGSRGRYFCDGPEGHFFCDDLKLARDLVNAYDKDDDWTITDLQATSAETGSDAGMFWNANDPGAAYDSIGELINEEWGFGSVMIGDTLEIQRAIRLPNITVRIRASEEFGVDYDIEPVQATSAEVGE